MQHINKYRVSLFSALTLITAYLFTRIYNLLSVPIFTDEAIYIRWSQRVRADPVDVFVSLTDGKQPLLTWINGIYMYFIHNPLLATRLVSVTAGLLTVIGLVLLAHQLFCDKRIAFISCMLYIISPFAIVYNKLALYDSLVAMFAVWALYLEVILIKKRRLDIAFITALVIGGGLLTKSSAFFFLYLLPFSLLLFDYKAKSRKLDFLTWLGLATVVVIFANICYSVLRLSPYFGIINDKNNYFIYSISEWMQHPLIPFTENLPLITGWLISYITAPILILAVSAFLLDKRKFYKEKLLLFAWFIVPIFALILLGKTKFLFPRYILFMTMPLFVLASYSLDWVWRKVKPVWLKVLFVAIGIIPCFIIDFYLLTNFSRAPIPKDDKTQLISGFASGVGLNETVQFLESEASKQPLFVATASTFGLLPQGLEVYLANNPNIYINGYWPITKNLPKELEDKAKTMPVYVIFYAPCNLCDYPGAAPEEWSLTQVKRFKKLETNTYLTIYKVDSFKD